MFVTKCKETSMNIGYSIKQGVCRKTAEGGNPQDLFIWVLKGIAYWGHLAGKKDIYIEEISFFIVKGLITTITNADFNKLHIINFINKGIEHRNRIRDLYLENFMPDETVPDCSLWKPVSDEEIIEKAESGVGGWLKIADEDIRSPKATVPYGLKGMSAYLEHGYQIKQGGNDIFLFIMDVLSILSDESATKDKLLHLVIRTGEFGVKAMRYLDEANAHYGDTEMTEVNIGTEQRPGIFISGQDFVDHEELMKQSQNEGIDVYTHCEIMPAHYRPQLKKYSHLKANYGSSWHLQKSEIINCNGSVLFSSNCVVTPDKAGLDKIFNTGAVGFQGATYQHT